MDTHASAPVPVAPDGWPSFRRRSDVRRLVFAVVVPWLIMVMAIAGPLIAREWYRAGHRAEWLKPTMFIWFYGFGFPAMISLVAFFLIGLFRLIRWREYRWSWYGWVSAVIVWLNLCALTTVVTSKWFVML